MEKIYVYRGLGMYKKASEVLHRILSEMVSTVKYQVEYVTPEQIKHGSLESDVALLAIGGGYDLGLMKALDVQGMTNIRDYVHSGGSYLGFCSGAYFACDRIEFDKGGPLEVVGDRQLKFFPGCGIGPLYKPYVYNSRKGAVASHIDFKPSHQSSLPVSASHFLSQQTTHTSPTIARTGYQNGKIYTDLPVNTNTNASVITYSHDSNSTQNGAEVIDKGLLEFDGQPIFDDDCRSRNPSKVTTHECHVFFNGGGYFCLDDKNDAANVSVLSRYVDVPGQPAAIVGCKCGKGVAVLSGPHIEYEASDIDDGDTDVVAILPVLRTSARCRSLILKHILQELRITVAPLLKGSL